MPLPTLGHDPCLFRVLSTSFQKAKAKSTGPQFPIPPAAEDGAPAESSEAGSELTTSGAAGAFALLLIIFVGPW